MFRRGMVALNPTVSACTLFEFGGEWASYWAKRAVPVACTSPAPQNDGRPQIAQPLNYNLIKPGLHDLFWTTLLFRAPK